MKKLHELLAVEKTKTSASNKMLEDVVTKFGKDQYFNGYNKTLAMLKESPENSAIEEAAKDVRSLPTTVYETLEYALTYWAEAEDVIYAKNCSNQHANSDIVIDNIIVVPNVPVDELLGLESRLEVLRKIMDKMPTLDASKDWQIVDDGRRGEHRATVPEIVSKTEKIMTPVILSPATDKHPAQIEKVTKDEVIGTFTRLIYSGAATSKQKATILGTLDNLLVAVKQARMRANSVEVSQVTIGSIITNLILKAFE